MTKLSSLDRLYELELQELYSAENQLMTALPEMESAVTDESLRKAIVGYREETRNHIGRLEKAFAAINVEPGGVECACMKGLLIEFKQLLSDEADPKVLDCALIANLRRIQHLQIAGYGIVRTFADQQGYHQIAELLLESLNEQEKADKALTALGIRWVNVVAAQV